MGDDQRSYNPPRHAVHPWGRTEGYVFANLVKTDPSLLCLCSKLVGHVQSGSQTFAVEVLHRSSTLGKKGIWQERMSMGFGQMKLWVDECHLRLHCSLGVPKVNRDEPRNLYLITLTQLRTVIWAGTFFLKFSS